MLFGENLRMFVDLNMYTTSNVVVIAWNGCKWLSWNGWYILTILSCHRWQLSCVITVYICYMITTPPVKIIQHSHLTCLIMITWTMFCFTYIFIYKINLKNATKSNSWRIYWVVKGDNFIYKKIVSNSTEVSPFV